MSTRPRVVIVGGGFGGLNAARALRGCDAEVVLLDRRNFHLFQPLLYQVATGGLSPANIASPLRKIFRRQPNVRVLLAEVCSIDATNRMLALREGELTYDVLVLAAGARHHYFGHDEWEAHAPGLKTLEDATSIRRRMLLAFEKAERETDAERVQELLTFVVVGGGATGVELAGTMGEITRDTLRRDFRQIDPGSARILLVEGAERVLAGFAPELSERAEASLRRLGVTVRCQTRVDEIAAGRVILRSADDGGGDPETVATSCVLWAAGVRASDLADELEASTKCERDRGGRIMVEPDLTVPGYPEIFVIGDMAHFAHGREDPLPGVAPVAMQQGRHVVRVLRARWGGRAAPGPFRYKDRGSMATIGRAAAVAEIRGIRFSGYPAWLAWLFIHLAFLIGFDNKILVLFQWAWSYLTFNRGARLIVGGSPAPPDEPAPPPDPE